MEKFKINSQELIESAGGNEDIFDALNSPDSHIFSLQRFANVTLRQEASSSTKLLSSDSLTGVLSAFTLGRSTDSSVVDGVTLASAATDISIGNTHFYIAPLYDGTNTWKDESYKLTAYNLGVNNNATDVRIAIAYNNLPAHTSTGSNPAYNYPVGILTSDTNILISPDNNSFSYSLQPWSGTYILTDGNYESLYRMMVCNDEIRFGSSTVVVASESNKFNITLDFYDVKLASHTASANLDVLDTGTYVYRDTTGKSINFKSDSNSITFDGIAASEKETYTLNGIGLTLQGGTKAATATMTASSYNTTGAQTFTSVVFNSDASIAFDLTGAGSGTGISINGITYKSTNDSGTVMFSMSGTDKFITLGLGNFALGGVGTETYNLATAASGTFGVSANSTFTLDVDGSATGFAPISFIAGTNGASVTGIYNSSDIQLSGNFTSINTDSLTKLQFTLSNTAVAGIGNYTFTDVDDGSNTIVHFTSASDISVSGIFSVTSGESVPLSSKFTLGDSSIATFGSFVFSDTGDGQASFVQFGTTASEITLGGSMSGTGSFANLSNAIITLQKTGTYVLDDATYTVNTNNEGTGTANQLSFLNTAFSLSTPISDTFASDFSGKLSNVTVSVVGSNITTAAADITVEQSKAKYVNDLYIYNTGSTSLTISSSDSNTTITGAPFIISAVGTGDQSNTLIGLSGHNFTATGLNGSFYLADGGTGTSINGLTFTEASDGFVTKLALNYGASATEMGVFGSVKLTGGSNSSMVYALNGIGTSNSFITMSGITFGGSATGVQNTAVNAYTLTNSGTGVFSITGASTGAESFTMLANTAGGSFLFGADSTTGIVFASSGTNVLSTGVTAVFGAGALGSATATNAITFGSGVLDIDDATGSEGYRVLLNANGTIAGIDNIDGGASLTSVASATSVITNNDGTFTFTTFNGKGKTGSTTQLFTITNDSNGVTFTLDSATGLVTSISGIDSGATVAITDVTEKSKNNVWKQTFTATGTWTAERNGVWGIDTFRGYIVDQSNTAFVVKGIEATNELKHTTLSDYTEMGTSTDTVFTVLNSAFDGTATSVFFQNQSDTPYSANFSNTSHVVFTNLSKTGEHFGILYGTDTGLNGGYLVDTTKGTATTVASLNAFSDTNFSVTLGEYAINVYSDTTGAYRVNGAGVGLNITSDIVTVGATADSLATIFMPDEAKIAFSTTGIAAGYIINSNTFTVNAVSGSVASATKSATSGIFEFGLSGGSILSDTYTSASGGDSSLSINGTTFGLYGTDSNTFTFATSASGSDTLSVALGTVGVIGYGTGDSSTFIGATQFGLSAPSADGSATFMLDAFSYTGVADASFTLAGVSGTQLATVSQGVIEEDVASGTSFFFNGSLFTATSSAVAFQINNDATSNTLLAGSSATGILSTGGQEYTIDVLSDTFTMNSGSSVIMTYDADSEHYAKFDFKSGTGSMDVSKTQTFALNDYWMTDGQSSTEGIYTYTAQESGTLTLSLTGQDSGTIALGSVFGIRTEGSDTHFTFNPEGYTGATALDYTTTGTAFTFSIDSGTLNAGYSAFGEAYAGSATRLYTGAELGEGDAFTSMTMQRAFNTDTYMPTAGALMTLNVVDGVGSETFTSGSGTFTAAAGEAFHFAIGSGDVHSYTALTNPVILGAYFTSDTSKDGVLYSASGSGTRLSTAGDGSTFWSFGENIGDSYTMQAGATMQLTIGGVADGLGLGTETVTAGTGTYTVSEGGLFHISQGYLDGASGTALNVDSYTYTAMTGGGGVLTAVIGSSGTQITLDSNVAGTRQDASESFVFNTITYQTTSDSLTYLINSTIASNTETGAAGSVYVGAGTRTGAEGSFTSLFNAGYEGGLSFQSNTYTLFSGADIGIDIKAGVGTETFLSGSSTFTADTNGVFYFSATSDTKNAQGALLPYTATSLVTLDAYFSGSDTDKTGSLISASGEGFRLGSGTYVVDVLNSNTYKMDADATITLTLGSDTTGVFGTEKFTAGNGTYTIGDAATSFAIADAFLQGTYNSGTELGEVFTYTASGTGGFLSLTLGTNTKIALGGGLVGTREVASGTTFEFDPDGDGDLPTYTYTAASTLIYSIKDGDSATGVLFSGYATRTLGEGESTTALAREFNGDSYTAMAGAILGLNVENGATVVTETFISGSGMWKAVSVGSSVFHFDYSGDGSIDENEAYTALSTETALYANFVADSTDTTLFNAIGGGTRITAGTDTYAAFGLGDSYTMAAEATKTLTFDGTEETPAITGTEYFTSGTGVYNALIADSGTFTLNDYWLSGGKSETFTTYTYTAIEDAKLTITLDGKDSGTITVDSGVGTRESDTNQFYFEAGLDTKQTYTKVEGTTIYYSIDSDVALSDGADGAFYSGTGTRVFNSSDETLAKVGIYNEKEFTPFSGTVAISVVDGKGTDTMISGAATWASKDGEEFKFVYDDGTSDTYTADGVVTLYGTVSDGKVTGLFDAIGSATRTFETELPYTIDALGNSDVYTLTSGTITLEFSEEGDIAFSNTSVMADTDVTKGEGSFTAYAATSETFTLNDDWLAEGETGTKLYTYTAHDSDVVLKLTLTDEDSGTITIDSGFGTRQAEEDETEFVFTPSAELGSQTYTADGDVYYSIEKDATNAKGEFYAGTGYREFTNSETSAELIGYLGDKYTAYSGTVVIDVEARKGTETITEGAAIWKAENDGEEFHFVYNDGETQTYSASAGTTLYGVIEYGTVTSLFDATGSGSRTTTDTEVYTINDLNGESYELDSDATVTLTFSNTGVVPVGDSTWAEEDFTSGHATKTIESGTTFTLNDYWYTSGASGTAAGDTYVYTAEGDVKLTLEITGKDSGTIRVTSGEATYQVDAGGTFKYSSDGQKRYEYIATEEATYGINSDTKQAVGDAYGSVGSRTYTFGEITNATLAAYNSDTYVPYEGTMLVTVEGTVGTETFTDGSAIWTPDEENNGEFRFDYNGDDTIQANEVYTAAASEAALYATVENNEITGLFNATGSATRTTGGTETYTAAGLGDVYTLNEGANVELTFSEEEDSIAATETYTSGAGTYTAAAGEGTFTVNDSWLTGGESTEAFTYTATEDEDVQLSITLEGPDSGTIAITSGFGTREETDTKQFTFNGHEYTAADEDTLFYSIGAGDAASGTFYTGAGTRGIEEGDSLTATYLSDTYTVTEGTISINVEARDGSDTFAGGSATFTAEIGEAFHFASSYGTYAYTATSAVELNAYFSDSETGVLYEASGAGARDIDSAMTLSLSELNNDEYTFNEGTVQLSITSIDEYTETLLEGTGYMTATGTFTAAFNADGTIGDKYTYTASEEAVLSATFADGAATSQSFISGAATRAGIEGSDNSFTYNDNEYTIQDVANTTFVLNEENASEGAAGTLYNGFGLRDAVEDDEYSVEGGNTYTEFDEGSQFRNGYTNGEIGENDTLYSGSANLDFDPSDTFMFKGTEYIAGDSGATMALTAQSGTVTEKLSAGSGLFDGEAEGAEFEWDENIYKVSGTAVLELFANSDTPVFREGTGVKDMAEGDTFKFSPDGNTYTLTSDEGRLIAQGNGGDADVYFTSGEAQAEVNAGDTFNYKFEDESHTYTAAADGATLGLTAVDPSETSQATLVDGAGSRTQDGAEGQEFEFEGNNYNSVSDTLTWTLEVNSETTEAYEHVTGGFGSREITDGEFVYMSPIDEQTHTYQAQSVVLDLELVNGEGTETFVSGEATRAMEIGDTFELAPDKFEFDGSGTMTFTATEEGTYKLTAKGSGDDSSEMLFMGYNIKVVEETIEDGVATGTAVSPFRYESKVTSEKETYTTEEGEGVIVQVTVSGGANTATWISGTATMTLDADRTFVYTPDEGSEHTYTATGEGATFTRTSEEDEVFSAGEAYRMSEESDTYTVTDALDNEYTVDAGARIALVVSETEVTEILGSGSATFTGTTFNYEVDGASHTYTAEADVVLQGSVVDGEFGELIAVEGVGTRELEEGDTTTVDVLGDEYVVDSGKFSLTLETENIGSESEVLVEGAGTFSTTDVFHVNDYYFGDTEADSSVSIEYTAYGDSSVTLSLAVEDGSSTITFESGIGTRGVETETFTFNDVEYTDAENVVYAISSTGLAAGYLFNAVGTRTTEEEGGTTVFNSDTYNVEAGATMVLTVTEGVDDEVMTAGSATYVANDGDVFHFDFNQSGTIDANEVYTAVSETTMQIVFEGDTATRTLSAINGTGTREAFDEDSELTMTYQEDDYHAVAGSSTIVMNATSPEDATEELLTTSGVVVDNVNSGDTFHTDAAGEWYEYVSENDVDIALNLDDSVQTFSGDVSATRTASDTTFLYNEIEYTANDGTEETYRLTGSGTNLSTSDLTDAIFEAEGYREITDSETFVSNLNNTYDITSGTYSISISDGVGTETLSAGAGIAEFATDETFNYFDSATSFVANIEGATLSLTMDGDDQVEVLTAGAGAHTYTEDEGGDGVLYIMAGDAKATIEGSTNVTIAAEGNEDIAQVSTLFDSGIETIIGAEGITASIGAGGEIAINNKLFGAEAAAVLSVDSSLGVFEATSGTVSAEGDFVQAGDVTLAGNTIDIGEDTDVAVFFSSNAINKLGKVSGGALINDAAGATRVVTDSDGEFQFTANNQTFVVQNDAEITFQLDSDGLVTGIAGIDAGDATSVVVDITDGEWTDTITISTAGQVLKRNDDGTWTDTAVVAESYIVSLDSADSLTVYAVDSAGDLNKIDSSSFARITSDSANVNLNVTAEGAVTEKEVYVVNQSDKLINVSGAANLNGIGLTSETAAVQLTTENGQFVAGNISGSDFTEKTELGVANGKFSIDAAGTMAVAANGAAANVTMSANDNVVLVATTSASNFAVNGGDAVTLAIGSADADGQGMFTAKLSDDNALTGLNPHGVDTGTAVVTTGADSVTFSINDSAIVVEGDDGTMTLEIATDTLVGLSDISTDASINASAIAGTELAINGDTDNKVTASTEPIKYNATQEKWITGDATSIEGATGYLVSLSADGTKVELYFTTSDTATPKLTTNKADYEAVLSGTAPANDGEQPDYAEGIVINSSLDSDISVSIAAGSTGITATMSEGNEERALSLVTADGNYTINEQEVIPNAEITVNAVSTAAVAATLNASTTIEHEGMSLTADSDSQVVFSSSIVINDTAKVTNTNDTATFLATGTVSFDNIVVKAGANGTQYGGTKLITGIVSTVAPAALTVDDKDLNVVGGDTAFTVDVSSEATPIISGINGDATVTGALIETAKVLTASAGTFSIGSSNAFTITDDAEVSFITSNDVVTAIDSLVGTATGNFSTEVGIDSDHTVLILNDTEVSVTANGTQVTAIDGVGSADSNVIIANAGGATIVTTDINGSVQFGNSNINRQRYNVTDEDSQVSFLTSSLTDYTPSVSGVQSLSSGSIAIGQDESGFGINDQKVTLGGVSNDVTLAIAESSITSVLGLEGEVSGLATDVVVNAIDSDVTVNGAALQVVEGDNTNLTVYASAEGFDTVTGLNTNAVVTTAKNAHVVSEEEGIFTFVDDTFTISGDSSVTFETDGESKVINVGDFAGTLKSSAEQTTVNGAVVGTTNTDASIVSAGSGVSSVLGLADGDAVTVPSGVVVGMPGTSDADSDTALTVNGKPYYLENDTDGVAIRSGGATGSDTIDGLAANASLTVGAAGRYNVNGEILNANIGDVIIGDEEGSAHIYDSSDITFDSNTTTEDIISNIIGGGETTESRYTENLDSEQAAQIADELASGNLKNANGNIEMAATNADSDETQNFDFANTTGIKSVSLEGGNQDVAFNNAGGNVAVIPNTSANTDNNEKNVTFGDGGDLGVVANTGMPVNFTFGKGRDTLVTSGRHVRGNLTNAGRTTLMPLGGRLNLEGYDADKGQSIQSTLSNIFQAIKKNIIKLANDIVTMNNGAVIDFSGGASSSDAASDVGARVVNFKNVKGLNTRVLYTYDEGDKDIDLADVHEDTVIKANYTEGSAQRKSGTEIIRTGSGNDTAMGGSGDTFNLGSGYNRLYIDENRNLSEAGTIVEQTATTGITEVDGFHAEYSDTADKVRIDTSKASVKFEGGALKFTNDAATLVLNAVSSSSDLASSADETDSRIGATGTGYSQKALVEDVNDSSTTRLEVAAKDAVINVERVDDLISQSYMGENSGVNLGTFDEESFINLNTGEGNLGGEFVRFGGITKLQGGNGSNTLIGSGGSNNTIAAGVGVSSIWGGGASNDTMSGVGGTSLESLKTASTSFFFMNGDGKDQIQDFTFLTDENGDVADKVNIYTAAVTDVQLSGNDVIISLNNEEDKLTMKNAIGKDFRVEYGDFGSANTVTAQVQETALDFNGRADYFKATGRSATLTANSSLNSADIWLNNDRNYSSSTFLGDIKYLNASGIEGQSTLVGNSNNNYIIASSENSSMWGGQEATNDTLVGGAGADVFWYGKNEGSDVIQNVDGSDTVNLYDASLADLGAIDVTSNTVTIAIKDSTNVLRVQGNITGTGFRMSDGTTYAVDGNRNWYQKN